MVCGQSSRAARRRALKDLEPECQPRELLYADVVVYQFQRSEAETHRSASTRYHSYDYG